MFYIIIFGIPLINPLCSIFVITPLAKKIIQRKIIFLTSILPTITLFISVASNYVANSFHGGNSGNLRAAIIPIYILTLFFIIYILTKFIKSHVSWKHYILLIILLLSSAYTMLFNWAAVGPCFLGGCF